MKQSGKTWKRVGIGALAVAVFLVLTAVALRYWITSSGGRGFIVSQIDGRKLGPLGVIRLSGLEGDPLTAASLADLALVDDDGVWLRAKNVRVKWTPWKLFSGELEIAAIDIRSVDVVRRPHATFESENKPPPDIGLKLENVGIAEFKIADGVFGSAASYKVGGGAARGRDGSGFLRIGVQPLTGPGDRLSASAEWSAKGSLKGEAEAFGPVGGAIAGLLQAPEKTAVQLDGKVDGSFENFVGALHVAMADKPVGTIDVSRAGDAAKLTASIDVEHWPLFASVAERTGGPLQIAGEANVKDLKAASAKLTLDAPAGEVQVAGPVDFKDFQLGEKLHVHAQGVDLKRITPTLAGRLDADGEAQVTGLVDWSWQGDAAVADLAFPSGFVKRAAGKVSLRQQGTIISWQALETRASGAALTSLKRLAPADYDVDTRGTLNLATRIVDISQAQVKGAPGSASGRGTYSVKTGAMEFSGAASLERLADVAPLTGAARGQWTVKRSGHDAPIRISVDAAGRKVGSGIASLNELLGGEPHAVMSAVWSNGRLLVESGRIDGAAVTANMTGRIEDSGAVSGRATGHLRKPLDLGAAHLEALDVVAVVSGKTSAPQVNLNLGNGRMTAAGVAFTGLGGTATATLGDKITGKVALNGEAAGQKLRLGGRLTGGGGAYGLADVTGGVGDLKLTAPQIGYKDGVVHVAFTADGPLAGLQGITDGALTAKGDLTSGNGALTFKVNGQASNVRSGAMTLQLVAFEGEAGDDRATVSGRVQGDIGVPINLAYSADGSRGADGGWTGQANLAGDVAKQQVATPTPVKWSYAAKGWSTQGALTAFGGRLDVAASDGEAGASSSFQLADVDLNALTRVARINPINGRVSGKSTFSNTAAGATADFAFSVANANPVGVTADPISVDVNAQLKDGRLAALASGKGQGFALNAQGQAPFTIGKGFDVAPQHDGMISANLTLHGRAEQLWALFGPEGQTLRGALDADVHVGGVFASPALTGGFSMSDGAYEQADSGLHLRQISAKGAFDQRSAKLTQITANDGQGGTLTGEGNIDWQDGLDGSVKFTASNLRALGRDDRLAIVSGDGAVTLDPKAVNITGKMTVEQARFSIEQPAAAQIPVLGTVRRVGFARPTVKAEENNVRTGRPIALDLDVTAQRRLVVFGRGLDSEWSGDVHVGGTLSAPLAKGQAKLVRGTLSLAGRRFDLGSGTIRFDGPVSQARMDISASRTSADINATVNVSGTVEDLKFTLTSTPALPQDEVLARVIFGRSASQLSGLEAAQLAAGLAQLAGGTAAFDPTSVLRQATGLDRLAIGGEGGAAAVSAGKYIADDVYVQLGAGGTGGVGAQVEWQPTNNVSVVSSAKGNGDTKLAVRWKTDY